MNILIPMAGAGSRFAEKGYKEHKPVIKITDRITGKKIPMVISATNDVVPLGSTDKIIYINRDFHKNDGVEEEIKSFFPSAKFITINYLTQGQASTCLLAKNEIENDEELLISACDNGINFNINNFNKIKQTCDAIIFTFKNNSTVESKPEGYGWVKVNGEDVVDVSVKIPISQNPKNDNAIVGTFWFKKGKDFVKATEKMIKENDRVKNEFYVDKTMKHCLDLGLKVKVFEVEKYICWGTPEDYENYENTIKYWQEFYKNEKWIYEK